MSLRRGGPMLIYCLAMGFVLAPIFTSMNNSYELQIGDRSLRGFYPLDGYKLALRNLFTLAPFFIGMRFLSSEHARALVAQIVRRRSAFLQHADVVRGAVQPRTCALLGLRFCTLGLHSGSPGRRLASDAYSSITGSQVAIFTATAVIAATVGPE